MAKRTAARRTGAPRSQKPSSRKASRALQDSLDGLRDALDLTLTRVLEDDMNAEEAQAVLRHLEKELDGFEKRIRPAVSPSRRLRRRPTAARRTRRMGER